MAKLADLCGVLRQGNRCKSNFYPFVYRLGCNQMVSILLEESFSCCSKSCFLNQLIGRVNMPRFPAPCQRVWMLARTMKVKAHKVAARIQDTQYFLERYAGDGRLPVVEETKVIRGILS